jgi:hypothetical protein
MMRKEGHLALLCTVLATAQARSQAQQAPKVEMPPPLTQEQQCLLNIATFKYPEMGAGVRLGWRQEGATLVAVTPHKLVIADAVRMDHKRRSAYASEDGASYFIIDRGGVTDETRWYGPIPAAELLASCADEAASTIWR